MEPEIIHIPELAKLLGRTESSIRSARQTCAPWLPPSFKQGSRICWRVSTVRQFLQEYENGVHAPDRPGRKRQAPPKLPGVK
ncbi:hypothetical protein AO069_02390 [Pseudomonas syringae pv. syringae PD2774]|uniref:hypothetical protein n=1 Tax=Pseudomonas syringae TaxID=317 RepID=UPI0007368EC4|nr:hypothetical protein [Pseudomonas syringae]KTB76520.1 hypothetical protein AO069_02390 [Pseudomonas syringae pv. syringae PD2774]